MEVSNMQRLVVAAFLLLAGCAGPHGPVGDPPPPFTSGFADDAPNVVEVVVRDRKPVDRAELLAPDGRVLSAYKIDRERVTVDPDGRPLVGIEAEGGSSGLESFGIQLPLFGIKQPKPESLMLSDARIRIDDMTAYRAEWPHWIVRLRLGTPETTQHDVEFPAPRPPESK
jgi:hypothetical protein